MKPSRNPDLPRTRPLKPGSMRFLRHCAQPKWLRSRCWNDRAYNVLGRPLHCGQPPNPSRPCPHVTLLPALPGAGTVLSAVSSLNAALTTFLQVRGVLGRE